MELDCDGQNDSANRSSNALKDAIAPEPLLQKRIIAIISVSFDSFLRKIYVL